MNKKDFRVDSAKMVIDAVMEHGFSYNDVLKMLRLKDIRVNGVKISQNQMVTEKDVITIFYREEPKFFDVVFDGEETLIVCKKAGIETEGLAKRLNLYPVHRLDRNTEGLVIFAKTTIAQKLLEKAFKSHLVRKFYLTEVVGEFEVYDKLFTAYLVKDAERSLVKIYDKKRENSKKIETKISTLKHSPTSSLLKVEIIGGKTHQIRAHLAHLGHAIIGDGKYGKREDYKRFKCKHQKLFAYKLIFGNVGIAELDGKEFKVIPDFVKDLKIML